MSDLFVDNIKHQSSQGSGTITIGASGESVGLASGVDNKIGISNYTMWYVTGQTAVSADTDTVISTNWVSASNANGNYKRIGDEATQSSGVFTLPRTGIWEVSGAMEATANGTNSRFCQVFGQVTTDNSTYSTVTTSTGHFGSTINSQFIFCPFTFIFDCENTTTHKVRLACRGDNAFTISGQSDNMRTNIRLKRLADT